MKEFLDLNWLRLEELASIDFQRAVILGSGHFLGLARETHLKIQELSDGQVVGKHDSFLGLRHGPKAVINNKTLLCAFLSTDSDVMKYEKDLILSLKGAQRPLALVGVGADVENGAALDWGFDHSFSFSGLNKVDEILLTLAYLVPMQCLAALKSLHLGLNPDSPSARGAIHRVVQGVTIYPRRPL